MGEEAEQAATTSKFALKNEKPEDRGEWSSRFAFYMATIGAAVGFGNVWRFPALSVSYGGGAFFVPYLMALFLIGIPLAILEIGFGQYFQTGDIGVFGGFHPRLRGVGLASVFCGFMLNTYYVALISWVVNVFFSSWDEDAPWNDPELTGAIAKTYFQEEIIGGGTWDGGHPTRLVGKNVGYCFMVWVIIFLCVAWGVKWTGRVAYATMGIPIVLLFVFLGKALTLEGASDGVKAYIGIWDMSVLTTKPEVWSTATSQIFFSIGLTFGILTAFGSHCPKSEPAALNAVVVSLANSMFSIIAGFAVFGALGHLASVEGVAVDELQYGGFSLVFGTWPVVFNTLPGGIHWVRLIFFNLFLLGIDSAFAFLEAFITVLHDTVYFQNVPRFWLALGMAIISFLFSLIYCTDAGEPFLDSVDFYINFVMILVGFFEAFGSAWAYDITGQLEIQGKEIVYSFWTANFGAVILGCIVWYAEKSSAAVWAGFVMYFGWYILGVGVTIFFISKKVAASDGKWTMGSLLWEVYMGNILRLRDRMQDVIGLSGIFSLVWCALMKHFIPNVLIVLFINLAVSKNDDGKPTFGNVYGLDTHPFQVLGIIVVVFTLLVFLVGVILPDLYAPLALPQNEAAKAELEKYEGAAPEAAKEPEDVKKIEDSESVEQQA